MIFLILSYNLTVKKLTGRLGRSNPNKEVNIMIIILEIPHTRPVSVWSALNKEDMCNTIVEANHHKDTPALEETAVFELPDLLGLESLAEIEDYDPELFKLIYGRSDDTLIYKRFDDEHYTLEAPDKFETFIDYNAHDLNSQRVFMSIEEAKEAINDEAFWNMHQGVEAKIALKDYIYE